MKVSLTEFAFFMVVVLIKLNAAELLALSDIDGLLVGGASLDAEHFALICAQANENA